MFIIIYLLSYWRPAYYHHLSNFSRPYADDNDGHCCFIASSLLSTLLLSIVSNYRFYTYVVLFNTSNRYVHI